MQLKHLVFDNDALVSINDYNSESLLQEFVDAKSQLCYIDPVFIELSNTNNAKLRIQRQNILSRFKFSQLPISLVTSQRLRTLHSWLTMNSVFPSPTDIYLAGILDHFSLNQSVILVTSNIKDFPEPLFIKVGFIILHGEKSCKVLTLLKINPSVL